MSQRILATKLYFPAARPGQIRRPGLIDRLRAGFRGKLTLVSAPAGFGKTTLVSEWIAGDERPAAWLSLDDRDNDPSQFLTYVVAALQSVDATLGADLMTALQSPQPPHVVSLLTTLLNELATMPYDFVLTLDDYHTLDNRDIDDALSFLIDNQPPQLHLVIITREDPRLPLARLRARGDLNEIRAADLRFTPQEAAEFLQAMGLDLSADDVAILEARTEGWIAGLQLAAISMQGEPDKRQFVQSFSGAHHFVLDYLVEEALNRQPAHIHDFLLSTSILDRMCAPLCDAVVNDDSYLAEDALAYIRNANLFLIPLDNERRWYRYHHLFGDFLRKRLGSVEDAALPELHIRASIWYEANGLAVEAFQHAAAAEDIDRAIRLVEGGGTPLYLRGFAHLALSWLQSLSTKAMDSRPILWVMYAWVLWISYKSSHVEAKLRGAEAALDNLPPDHETNETLGRIAAMRAMLAANDYQTEVMIDQSHRALALLADTQDYVRLAVKRTLASAHHIQGNRGEAIQAYTETIDMCEASDNVFTNILATTGLGMVQEMDTQLPSAEQSYRRVLELVGDPIQPVACEASLGLARLSYEWNLLDQAEYFGEQTIRLADQIDGIDTAAAGQVLLARLAFARGDMSIAAQTLADVKALAIQRQFTVQLPRIVDLQIWVCLRQGDPGTAVSLLEEHDTPLNRARLALAHGEPAEALAAVALYRQQMEAKAWRDEILKALVMAALAHDAIVDVEAAMSAIHEAFTLAQPRGYVRTFIDEGQAMRRLVAEAARRGVKPEYARTLLTAFETERGPARLIANQPLIEPLSERELQILSMVADGLSNREISERLFISLSTVKGHNRNIFDKLAVKRRTEAVARARDLGLI